MTSIDLQRKILAQNPQHKCGGCEKFVPVKMPFCLACWRIIPKEMRTAIENAKAVGHVNRIRAAVGLAIEWHRDRKEGVQAR